jgi:YjbE family integral membrane protein
VHFLLNGLKIVMIDLLLAGDNALVIALAVRGLPAQERRIGIACGAGGAVLLRVALTAVAARLLTVPFLQIAGGLFVLWIAIKVLIDACEQEEDGPAPGKLWQAIRYIVLADITMSVDNILAIAGASRGNFWLILFGLALSIPFVVGSSHLLSRLMDRFPALIYMGAGILGQVGGEMILKDPWVERMWNPGDATRYLVEGGLAVAIIFIGWRLAARARRKLL